MLVQILLKIINAKWLIVRIKWGHFACPWWTKTSTNKRKIFTILLLLLSVWGQKTNLIWKGKTYDSKRLSICTQCCPNAILTNFPLSLTEAFQFKLNVICRLFAFNIVFKSSFVMTWLKGNIFASCRTRKFPGWSIWKISCWSSFILRIQ